MPSTKSDVFIGLTIIMISHAECSIKHKDWLWARRNISIAKHYLDIAKKSIHQQPKTEIEK